MPLGCLIIVAFAGIDEVSQIWVDKRDFETLDLLANILGAASSCLIVRLMRTRKYERSGFRSRSRGRDEDLPVGNWDGLSAIAWGRRRSKNLRRRVLHSASRTRTNEKKSKGLGNGLNGYGRGD